MVRTVGQRQAELAFQLSILFDPESALKVFLVIDKLCGTCGPIVNDELDEAIFCRLALWMRWQRAEKRFD